MADDTLAQDAGTRATFRLYQNGILMASASGPEETVRREAAHYALVYGQDGPVKLVIRRFNSQRISRILRGESR